MASDKNGLYAYHIIIKGLLHPIGTDLFKDVSGACCVEHREGLVQKERPHYHIWFPTTQSDRAVKTWLRTYYDTKIPDLKWNTHSNAYYCVKPHNDFEKWKSYVIDPETANCKKPSIVFWNLPDRPEVRLLDALILPAPGGETAPGVDSLGPTNVVVALETKSSKKRVTVNKVDQWCSHLKAYYQNNPDVPVTRHSAIRELIRYSNGGMNKFRVAEWVNKGIYSYLESSGEPFEGQLRDYEHLLFSEWNAMM